MPKLQRKKKKLSEKEALAARKAAMAYLNDNGLDMGGPPDTSTPLGQPKEDPNGFVDALTAYRKRKRREALAAAGVDVTVTAQRKGSETPASDAGGAGGAGTAPTALASKIGSLLSSIQTKLAGTIGGGACAGAAGGKTDSGTAATTATTATRSLPEGWEEIEDPESGDAYWWNTTTGAVTWICPGTHEDGTLPEPQRDYLIRLGVLRTGLATTDLPYGWELAVDADTGEEYYWNTTSDAVQWDKPTTSAARTARAPAASDAEGGAASKHKKAGAPSAPTIMLAKPGHTKVKFGLRAKPSKVKEASLFKLARKGKLRKPTGGGLRKAGSLARPMKKIRLNKMFSGE